MSSVAFFIQFYNEERRNERRRWRSILLIKRKLLRDRSDPLSISEERFQELFRVSKELFKFLFDEIQPHLSTARRTTKLPSHLKLLAALRFYATGCYQRSIGGDFFIAMSQSSICRIIEEVSEIIERYLCAKWIIFPTENSFNDIKRDFYENVNFPSVIGAVDGTHVVISRPVIDEHVFLNRKGKHSINTQIICDYKLRILAVNARYPGATHDSAIWSTCKEKAYLEMIWRREAPFYLLGTGLSSLLGQYMSDSDNEDEQNNSSTNINHKKQLNLNKNKTEEYFSSPVTAWTQCVDPVTEHPYYWNIETKEVTWDKPDEYEKYINYVYEKLSNIPDNCWVIGYTEDNKTPYYVNEYTRVVSWKKPANCQQPIHNTISSNSSSLNINNNCNTNNNINNNHATNPTQELKLTDAIDKINDNGHLERKYSKKLKNLKTRRNENSEFNLKNKKNYSDTEEKIELISSYSASSETSSDEETDKNNEDKRIQQSQKQKKNIRKKIELVAAVYGTDNEEDDDEEENDGNSSKSHKLKLNTQKLFPKTIKKNENNLKEIINCEINNENNINSAKNDMKTDSFASIITGGKKDLKINEEINRLKMELERELPGFETQQSTDENNTKTIFNSIKKINENCFDEKQFQRRKRIQLNTSNNDNIKQTITQNIRISTVCNESEISPESTDLLEFLKENQRKKLYSNFTKSHVEFGDNNSKDSSLGNQDETKIKAENSRESSKNYDDGDGDDDDDDDDNNYNVKLQIDDLSELLIGKVKFLSVGRPEVSTVQLMNIQLETLLAAYRLSSLNAEYFFKWLKTISDDLRKLEQTAIPDGWECNWDRQSSQYYYKNLETNEIRWEFPVTDIHDDNKINYKKDNDEDLHVDEKLEDKERKDEKQQHHCYPQQQQQQQQNNEALRIIRGEDEMDISTTPPPNEHEQIKFMGNWTADNAPPPPVISSEPALSADYYSTITKQKYLRDGDINCELASFYSDLANLETAKEPTADSTVKKIATADDTIIPVITDNTSAVSRIVVSQLLGPPLLSVANNNININEPVEMLTTSITAITVTTTASTTTTTTTTLTTSDDSGQGCSSSSVASLQVDVDLKQKKKKKLTEYDATDACNSNVIPKKKQKKIKVQGMGQKMKEVSTLVAKWQKVRKELDS